jgi:hypothetical protein
MFGDPAPDDLKARNAPPPRAHRSLLTACQQAIKIRYLMQENRAEVDVREATPGFLSAPLLLRCPKETPLLTIFDATYGPQGSGTYDSAGIINVTEKIRGL